MVRIVTDSTANLPPDLAAKHHITIVPLKVMFGDKTYMEGQDLSQEEFFRRLPTANPLPTTSQATPLEFEETYHKLLQEGHDIVSLHISNDLSGTYNSARNGVNATDPKRIILVDTRTVSAGLTLLVIAAAEMAEAGKSKEEIVAKIEQLMNPLPLVLTLDTLEYLKRGGRIGGAAAFIGGLLKIKPTIEVRNGKLEAGERARSRKKALEYLVEKQVNVFKQDPIWVGIANARADDVDEFETMLRSALNVQRLYRCEIGPVVATHTGPGTIGVVGMRAP